MLRAPTFLRAMARLALLAALLLALAPTASRVLASAQAQGLAGWGAVCTTDGLATHGHAPAHGTAAHADPALGEHCGYCALAAPLPLLLGLPLLLFARPAGAGDRIAQAPPRARPVRLCGLGAQGPPLPL